VEGLIKVMEPAAGDRHIAWDSSDDKGVAKAKKEFDKLKKKGFNLFKVDRSPSPTGWPVSEFDPDHKEYVAVPAMAGG
jgi:hypothetical protein